jgi:hypothetical protein
MNVVIIVLALSAVIGFALGPSFSWLAIAVSSAALVVLSSALLHVQGFGAVSGIVIVSACLTLNQIAYLVGGYVHHLGYLTKRPTRNQANVATMTLPHKSERK